MKILVLTLIVTAVLFAGCIGVDGKQLTIPDAYDTGFNDGCMASIFMLTSVQNRPPFEEAMNVCAVVREMAQEMVTKDKDVKCEEGCL